MNHPTTRSKEGREPLEAAVVTLAARLYVEVCREEHKLGFSRRALARGCVRAVLKTTGRAASVSKLASRLRSPREMWPGVEELEARAAEACGVLEGAQRAARALEEEMRLGASRVQKAETAAAAAVAARDAANAEVARGLEARCNELNAQCAAAAERCGAAEAAATAAERACSEALAAQASASARAETALEAAAADDERCAIAVDRARAARSAAVAADSLEDAEREARVVRDRVESLRDQAAVQETRRDRLAADLRAMERALAEARGAFEAARDAAKREEERLEEAADRRREAARTVADLAAEQNKLRAGLADLRRHRADLERAAGDDERRFFSRPPLEDAGMTVPPRTSPVPSSLRGGGGGESVRLADQVTQLARELSESVTAIRAS